MLIMSQGLIIIVISGPLVFGWSLGQCPPGTPSQHMMHTSVPWTAQCCMHEAQLQGRNSPNHHLSICIICMLRLDRLYNPD